MILARWLLILSCLVATTLASAATAPREPAPRKAASWTRWYVRAGFQSFQEGLTLTSGSQNFALIASDSLFYAGPEVEIFVNSVSSFDLQLLGQLGTGQAASATGSTLPAVTYTAQGVPLYGAEFRPAWLWYPGRNPFAFGFAVPLIYRMGSFPDPAAGYSLPKAAVFHYGVSIEARFAHSPWVFSTELGYLVSARSIIWGLSLGLKL